MSLNILTFMTETDAQIIAQIYYSLRLMWQLNIKTEA